VDTRIVYQSWLGCCGRRARRTNRQPFFNMPVPTTYRTQLVRAVESERAWLYVLSSREQRAKLRHLVMDAHCEQTANPTFAAELAAWTGRAGGHRVEGEDVESDPLLVVLCSFREGPLAELQAARHFSTCC